MLGTHDLVLIQLTFGIGLSKSRDRINEAGHRYIKP